MKKTKTLFCLLLSFLTTLLLPNIFKDDLVNFSYSNSTISIIIWICAYALLRYALNISDSKRLMWVSLCCGFLFSVFMVFGSSIHKNNAVILSSLSNWMCIFGLVPIFSSVVLIIFKKIEELSPKQTIADTGVTLSSTRIFLLIWLVIFVSWIPFFLASFPGVFGYDSVYQTNQYKNDTINLANPLAHTYLLGLCVVTIGDLLGSYEAGMAVYSIIQMLLISAVCSSIYTFFIRKRVGKVLRVLILLWYMFFPVNPIMGFSSTKDVLFSVLFTLLAMLLLMIAENPERLKSLKFCLLFAGTTFMMMAFRNQGIYVFVLAMIVAFFMLKKYRKRIVIISISCILAFSVYNGPFATAVGGTKSTRTLAEMMSVPCVQLSRAMVENADELTEEEKALIKAYIPKYSTYKFNAGISDLMKGSLDVNKIKEKPTEFIGLWTKVGLKSFGTYVNAFARLTIGLWYPDMNYRDPMAYHPYWEYWPSGEWNGIGEPYIQIKQTPVKGFKKLNNWLADFSYKNTYQKTPIVAMLFSSGLVVWICILYLAFCIYKKQYVYFVPCALIFGLLLTLLLGPVVLFRYVYPLFLCVPLILVSVFYISSSSNAHGNDEQ